MSHTILVADDSVTIRRLVQMVFKGSSAEVVEVEGGQEVLSAAYSSRPNAIVLDYNMPGHDSYELCRAIKSDPNLRQIPVVMLGGTYVPFDADRAKASGADDVVMKPFKTQILFDSVMNLVGGAGERGARVPSSDVIRPAAAAKPTGIARPAPMAKPAIEAAKPPAPEPPSAPASRRFSRPSPMPKVPTMEPSKPSESGRFRPIPPPSSRSRPSIETPRRFRRPDSQSSTFKAPGEASKPFQPPPKAVREPSRTRLRAVREPASRPPAPPTVAPGAADPVSLEAVQASVRREIHDVVKQLLPSIVKAVLTELFEERLAGSLNRFAEEHIKRQAELIVPAMAEQKINQEINRLLEEQE